MIQCVNGILQVKGTKAELMADVTVIINGLIEKNILDKEDLELILTVACMDSKDLENEARHLRESIALASLLFGDMEDK